MSVFRVYSDSSPSAPQTISPFDINSFKPAFTWSAATNPDEVHPSGWRVKIELDHEGRDSSTGAHGRWRSGELIRGTVELSLDDRGRTREGGAPPPPPSSKVTSVVLRAFAQSTTIFQSHRIVIQEASGVLAKLQPAAVGVKTISEPRAEWHRSFCLNGGEGTELWQGGTLEAIRMEVEGDFPLLEGEDAASARPVRAPSPTPREEGSGAILPFVFGLPTTTTTTASNSISHPPPDRRALQLFKRTPPASIQARNGSVEWIIEALVQIADHTNDTDTPIPETLPDFQPDLPPAFSPTVPHPVPGSPSHYGFLKSTPTLIVSRIVFPFEPSDHHSQDFYSSWRPDVTSSPWASIVAAHNGLTVPEVHDPRPITTGLVPSFGKDPRDEALGGTHSGPARTLQGRLVDAEGGREKWTCFEKRMPIRNVFGRLNGWVRCEVATPSPALISRHAASYPLLLHLSYPLPPKPAKSSSSLKPILLDKLVVMLSVRTLTRGGRDARPIFAIEELRRIEVKLWEPNEDPLGLREVRSTPSTVDGGRTHLKLVPGAGGHDVRVDFDLQTPGASANGKVMKSLKDAIVSFRAPNIEVEYILSATIQPIGHPCFYCLRSPVQVLAGDHDELTPFAAATADTAPPFQPSHAPDGLPGYHAA